MQRNSWRVLAVLVGTSAFAACSDITSLGTQSASGRYALATVDGYSLPYTFGSGSVTVSVQSDIYVISNNGTYTETTNETIYDGFQNSYATLTESGQWSQNGSALTFYPSYNSQGNLATYTGSLTGGYLGGSSLTIAVNGTVSVYDRQ